MLTTPLIETIKVAILAFDAQVERTRKVLETNNTHIVVTENDANAKNKLFEMIPANAEIFTFSSATLNALGVTKEIDESDEATITLSEPRRALMDHKTQNREMHKLGSALNT